MIPFLRPAGIAAVAFFSWVATAAWPQAAGEPDDQAAPPAQESPATLPGTVVERNVLVPVDNAGHPASNEFIVIERRVLTKEGASGSPPAQAPTRFILVPQDEEGDATQGDSNQDDEEEATPGR